MFTQLNKKIMNALGLAVIISMLVAPLAFASSVDASVVDVTAPTGSVILVPGSSGQITINMTVTGNQVGTATFDVYQDWELSGGTFTGSNSITFTVPPRAAQDAPTTFSTTGTVSIAVGQGAGTFTLAVSAFNITNSNSTGAKLGDGNDSNYQVIVSAPTDTTPPTITPSVVGTLGNNGWYTSDVTVSWVVTDPDSAIGSTIGCDPVTVNYDTAGVTLTCSATSAGGTNSQSVSVKVDKSAPTISGAPDRLPNATGWYNADVTVSFTCGDAMSGVATCSGPTSLGEGASQSVTGTATDLAGNSASATVGGINIDKTNPSVSLVGGPDDGGLYYFGFVPAAPTCSASDALSGLDGSCSVSGYSAAVGNHTVTASASDKAGNSASASATYDVLAWTLNGFYQPVDMNGVFNVVKGGSTVPLKFEVFAGTTELTSTTVVKSFVQSKVACDGTAATDEIEFTTTGGTSLRYDTTAGQFIQNWQTPKAAGTCYRVTMTTQDNSSLVAFFKLK